MYGRPSFPRYLLGSSPGPRPPFHAAYLAMWVHAVAGLALWWAFGDRTAIHRAAALVLGSVSLGLVVYGLRRPAYGLCLHVLSYGAFMARLFHTGRLDALLQLAAVIAAAASMHWLLTREYARYTAHVAARQDRGWSPGSCWPPWLASALVLLFAGLCCLGLYLG